jgi:hypothetical protein
MPEYQVYLLDQQGHIVRREDFEFPDNAQAIEKAKQQFVDGRAVELWSGTNLIVHIPPMLSFSSVEFLGADGPTRAKKCRELAAQAEASAANAADPEKKALYEDLSHHWHSLAEAIEAGGNGSTPP